MFCVTFKPILAQAHVYCSPNSSACSTSSQQQSSPSCGVSCTGLYADVVFTARTEQEGHKLERLYEQYYQYKRNYVKQIKFDPTRPGLGK